MNNQTTNQYISKSRAIQHAGVAAVAITYAAVWTLFMWAAYPIESIVGGGVFVRSVIGIGGGFPALITALYLANKLKREQ